MAAQNDARAASVVVEDVHMEYSVRTSGSGRGLAGKVKTRIGLGEKTQVEALRGVSLLAEEGEFIGVIGANGSGKSTLLRLIAGVEKPTRGQILARRQPTLLGVNAALQPALSGAANVRLGCLAMGMSPEQTESVYEDVVRLSALGDAIKRPMGGYSSGMAARLRFAIAVAARPKILLIDEALSTGDATFAQRSEEAMNEMLSDAGTVFLVNHAAKVIQELCTRAIWMHEGTVIMDGDAEYVAEKYRWWAWNVAKGETKVAEKLLDKALEEGEMQNVYVLPEAPMQITSPRHATRVKGRGAYRTTSTRPTEASAAADQDSLTGRFPETDLLPVVNDVVIAQEARPVGARHVSRR